MNVGVKSASPERLAYVLPCEICESFPRTRLRAGVKSCEFFERFALRCVWKFASLREELAYVGVKILRVLRETSPTWV